MESMAQYSESGRRAGSRRQTGASAGAASRSAHRAPLPSAGLLARTLRTAVIPRLVDAHGAGRRIGRETPAAAKPSGLFVPADVDDLARLVMAVDRDPGPALRAHLQQLLAEGVAGDDICCELLGPVARRLGQWWVHDSADFTEVTVGVGRLQQAMREMPLQAKAPGGACWALAPPKRILMQAPPGEQHTFGLVMVSDMFARAGWQVDCGDGRSESEILDLVRDAWFDVIGFSLANRACLQPLARHIARLRYESCNTHVAIIAGGGLLADAPGLAGCLALDAVVVDGRSAVDTATRLVLQRTLPP